MTILRDVRGKQRTFCRNLRSSQHYVRPGPEVKYSKHAGASWLENIGYSTEYRKQNEAHNNEMGDYSTLIIVQGLAGPAALMTWCQKLRSNITPRYKHELTHHGARHKTPPFPSSSSSPPPSIPQYSRSTLGTCLLSSNTSSREYADLSQ